MPNACQPVDQLGVYGSVDYCQAWGCQLGMSECWRSGADLWACDACKQGCLDGVVTACPAGRETAQGCLLTDTIWGDYLTSCICQ